jgi:hypothetical protein
MRDEEARKEAVAEGRMADPEVGNGHGETAAEDGLDERRPRPLQFRLRTLLGVAVACAAIFGTLNWLGVPPETGYIVLAVLAVSVVAALGLLVVIAASAPGGEEDGNDRK